MFKKIKCCIVPCDENNCQPHSLRNNGIKILLGTFIAIELIILLFLSPFFPKKLDYLANVLPGALVSFTNHVREEQHLPDLKENPLLAQAAQLKANDMASRGYFSHKTPEGQDPWIFLNQVGYGYASAGENLAVNFTDSKAVHNAWMNSPTHRANILQGKFTEVGIATAEGKYKGKDVIFVAQFFGRPSALNQASVKTPIVSNMNVDVVEVSTPVVPATEVAIVEVDNDDLIEDAVEVRGAEVGLSDQNLLENKNTNSVLVSSITSAPISTLSTVLWGIFYILILSLVLMFIKDIQKDKNHLIRNGTILVFIIGTFLYLNNEIIKYFGAIASV